MTTPSEPGDSLSLFEQQLKQLKPTPITGWEEMLFQAGWSAALQSQAAALEREDSARGVSPSPASPRSTSGQRWLGFFGGAASGMVAAGLIFMLAAWSGVLSSWAPADSNSQVATAPLAGEAKPELATANPDATAPLGPTESKQSFSGFNVFAWLNSGSEALSQAIAPPRSQVLTTAPVNGRQLDWLLSGSAEDLGFDSRTFATDPPGEQPEILRYRPWDSTPSSSRF